MTICVESENRKLEEWKDILSKSQYEALIEMCTQDYGEVDGLKYSYNATEVFDYLVQWYGGIASGYEVRHLIETLYDVILK